jgi:hypothetical protein
MRSNEDRRQRADAVIRGGSDGESANFAPLLQVGQPVRRLDGSEVGVVVGIIFGIPERVIVRWVDGARLEPVEALIEVSRIAERPAMREQPDAEHLIRAKVIIGLLPRRTTTKAWIGYGSGGLCDGCDQPITSTDVEHAVDAIGLGTLHFHQRCMQLWEAASAIPSDIAGGSAVIRPTATIHASNSPTLESRRMATALIARCAWHPRNNGHAKLLGVSSWRERGNSFTDGARAKCAGRMYPAVHPPGIFLRAAISKRSPVAAVVVAFAIMIGMVLATRPISDVRAPELLTNRTPLAPHGLPSTRVTGPIREVPLPRGPMPPRVGSGRSQRPNHVISATYSGSSTSVGRGFRVPSPAVPREASPFRTDRTFDQAP